MDETNTWFIQVKGKVKMLTIILAKIRTITLQITKHSLSFRIRLLEEKSSYLDYSCYSNSRFSDAGMKSMQKCTKKNVLKIANRNSTNTTNLQWNYKIPSLLLTENCIWTEWAMTFLICLLPWPQQNQLVINGVLCLYKATITTATRKGGRKYCCLPSLTNSSRKMLGIGSSLDFQELGSCNEINL